jgi:hypothetical protein
MVADLQSPKVSPGSIFLLILANLFFGFNIIIAKAVTGLLTPITIW